MNKLKVLEIFSGTQGISSAFRKRGHETFTIDFNPIFKEPEYENTDLCMDILEVSSEIIIESFGKPDIIWMSPDCRTLSMAGISHHRRKEESGNLKPISDMAKMADDVMIHVLQLIKELKPKYYFIENPRAGMRSMDYMQSLIDDRHTTTYCQWGYPNMKPTDLWTNHPNPRFKPPCKNGAPCHARAPRGSRQGTEGGKNCPIEKAKIPKELCQHIVRISEE